MIEVPPGRFEADAALAEIEQTLQKEREVIAQLDGQAVDLEPLKSGEATTQRPNRKQRRSMTRRQKQETGVAFELRHAKEIIRRAGGGPKMTVVRSRNGA